MLELIKNTKIDVMGKKKIAFIFSGILSIIGIIAIIQIANGKANLGIDFAGGTSIQLKFEKPVVLHDVRKALEEGGLKDSHKGEKGGAKARADIKRGNRNS
jgi:preprotein translocase subunit SecF